MKYFNRDGKLNYVDKNNKVVGFDMSQHCCEQFDMGVCGNINGPILEGIDIDQYVFADEMPKDCMEPDGADGGGKAWRLIADGLPDLWLVIWNHHNGYYSHGFDAFNAKGRL